MRTYAADERGQVLVLIAAAIAGLLLGIGLTLDTGQLFVARRAMQTASDAAAWAGATVLYAGGNASQAQTAATTDATATAIPPTRTRRSRPHHRRRAASPPATGGTSRSRSRAW